MTGLLVFQLRRIARNGQYVFFTILLPALFTVFFTKVFAGQADRAGNYQAYALTSMVSMMAYGAIGAALGGTARLAFDRASGWLRQLRITPIPTSTVVAVDVIVGGVLVLPSLVVVALVGRFVNGVQLDLRTWVSLVAVLWVGSVVFVAFGLILGLALDGQAAGGAIGIVTTGLAALGGLWIPVEVLPAGLVELAHWLPSFWYAELGRDVVEAGAPSPTVVLAVAGYSAAFTVVALLVARRRPLLAVAG